MFSEQVTRVIGQVDALRHEVDDHWQIPREQAQVLAMLVTIGGFRSLCEVGTSYGFSTLHLAAAAQAHGGRVYSFDKDPRKHERARAHLADAGLLDGVTLQTGDARQMLSRMAPQEPYDFLFIDAVKEQSSEYLEAVMAHLAPRTVVVTDNTLTHREELVGFVSQLRMRANGRSCCVAVGNGMEWTVLSRARGEQA